MKKKRVFSMDKVLAGIVQQPEFSSFTITTLRMEYERSVAGQSSLTSSKVRKYVYKQVCRMHKLGWVTKNGELRSRAAAYVRGEFPSGAVLKLIEPAFGGKAGSETDGESVNGNNKPSLPMDPDQCLPDIQARLNTARMDFISKVGEAETYKALISAHPALREKLEISYVVSRNESSSLMGQLRALEQTINVLGGQP